MKKIDGFALFETLIALVVIVDIVLPFVYWISNVNSSSKLEHEKLHDFCKAQDCVYLREDNENTNLLRGSGGKIIGVKFKNYEVRLNE